jgi:phosphatidylserine/phosphatidylglycerophosphate/cardiolipin synthase-like enzyme
VTQLVLNEQTYTAVLEELVPQADRFLWIITADIKDVHVRGPGGKYIPLLAVLAERLRAGVELRIIHAKEPGPRFRADFDRFPEFLVSDHFDRVLCPRMHMKAIIADGKRAYVGSANLTGAGLGAKSDTRRNFEAGIITEDPALLQGLMSFCDDFYTGSLCKKCGRRTLCPNPIA